MVLFLHGGGWVSGDLETHEVLARAMCNEARAILVYIDYRLAPEFPFPAGLEDAWSALQWMTEHAAASGGDPKRIAVAGDSAGGNLAAALAHLSRDSGEIKLVASWLMYPVLSYKMETRSWQTLGDRYFPTKTVNTRAIQAYIPENIDPEIAIISPLAGKLENLPPTLIQVGEYDPLRDESMLYGEALKNAGIDTEALVYKGQQHGFLQFYKDKFQHSAGEIALKKGVDFLKAYLYPQQ